jgi:hypothetical protein
MVQEDIVFAVLIFPKPFLPSLTKQFEFIMATSACLKNPTILKLELFSLLAGPLFLNHGGLNKASPCPSILSLLSPDENAHNPKYHNNSKSRVILKT